MRLLALKTLVMCPFILKEIRHILSKKLRLSQGEIAEATEPIREAVGNIVEHNLKIMNIFRDADDDNIIVCAKEAKADYLVAGDADLLGIRNHRGVKIITPRDFEALFV